MSGKQAKLARKAIRDAGGEDKVSSKRRIARQLTELEVEAQKAREEDLEYATTQQREDNKEHARRMERRIGSLMCAVGLLGASMSPVIAPIARTRVPRFQRRGR